MYISKGFFVWKLVRIRDGLLESATHCKSSYSKQSLVFDVALESLVGSNGVIAEIALELSQYFVITSVLIRSTMISSAMVFEWTFFYQILGDSKDIICLIIVGQNLKIPATVWWWVSWMQVWKHVVFSFSEASCLGTCISIFYKVYILGQLALLFCKCIPTDLELSNRLLLSLHSIIALSVYPSW